MTTLCVSEGNHWPQLFASVKWEGVFFGDQHNDPTGTSKNANSKMHTGSLKAHQKFHSKMPPEICNQSNFFEYFIFGLESKKSAQAFLLDARGWPGEKKFNPFRTEIVLETQSWTCACSATNSSHEGPPMVDPSTDLLPAQKLTASDAQKLTFRFLNVSEFFS